MPQRFRKSSLRRGAAAAVLAAVTGQFPSVALAQTADTGARTSEQTTRAAEERAKREAKATQLVAKRRGKVEAILYKIDEDVILQRIFSPPRGFHARAGGIAEGGGFGGGGGYPFTRVPF